MKRAGKYLLISIGSLLAIVAIVFVLTQTSYFRAWVGAKIVGVVTDNIRGTVTIGKVEGNLFTSIRLRHVLITDRGDTVVSAGTLSLDYDLSGILRRKIRVSMIYIDSLFFNLIEKTDGTWSYDLGRTAEQASPASPENTGLPWEAQVDSAKIEHVSAEIDPIEKGSLFPIRVRGLSLVCSGHITNDRQSFSVKELRADTVLPGLEITYCAFDIDNSDAGTNISGFRLRSGVNSVEGNAFLSGEKTRPTVLHLQSAPLDLRKFSAFLPLTTSSLRPACSADIRMNADSTNFKVVVADHAERISAEGVMMRKTLPPQISAKVKLEQVNLAGWLDKPELSSNINADVDGTAAGTSFKEAQYRLNATLRRSRFRTKWLDAGTIDAIYTLRRARGKISLDGPFGTVAGNVTVTNMSDGPDAEFRLNARKLNIAKITSDTSLASALNGRISGSLRTRSFVPESGEAFVTLQASTFREAELDSLSAAVEIQHRAIRADTFSLHAFHSQVRGSGTADFDGRFGVECSGEFSDSDPLRKMLKLDTLTASGTFAARVSGTVDSLQGNASINMCAGRVDAVSFGKIQADVIVSGSSKNLLVEFAANVGSPKYSTITADNIEVSGSYSPRNLLMHFSYASGDSIRGVIDASAKFDSSLDVAIPSIRLKVNEDDWQSMNDSAFVSLYKGSLAVNNLGLVSGDQTLIIDGKVTDNPADILSVSVRKFSLTSLRRPLALESPLSGTLGLDAKLSGPVKRPAFVADFSADEVGYGSLSIHKIGGNIFANDTAVGWKAGTESAAGRKMVSEGFIPMFIDTSGLPAVDTLRPLRMKLQADSLDLAIFRPFFKRSDSLAGRLSADVEASGTAVDTKVNGSMSIVGGSIILPRYGIAYRSGKVDAAFEDSVIRVVAVVSGGKGSLKAEGTVRSFSALFQKGLPGGELHLTASKFDVVKSDIASAVLDGSVDGVLQGSGSGKGLTVNGSLEVPLSRWYLPAFFKQMQQSKMVTTPMLVRATQKGDSIAAAQRKEGFDSLTIDLGVPLNGKVDIHIPRGTWVEGPKILAELSGDLSVEAVDSKPYISGSIEFLRGWVQMYGVRLTFQEHSRVTMKKGGDLVPDVALKMEYTFRDENREKKILLVDIHGSAKDPEIIFMLEGKEIKQEDALSYMLFGKSTSDVNSNSMSDAGNSANQMMEQMSSSLISSKLNSTVGRSLGIDMIELRGTDNWSKASLTGGKYFSDKVFVSFEKGFGTYDANEPIPEILTVEYEVYKFLFFELISGTDDRSGINVIVKFDTGTSP